MSSAPGGGAAGPQRASTARSLLRLGASAFVLVVMMFCASLLLWVGVPLGWLWVGSQVEAATGSLGAAVAAMIVGVTVTVLVAIPILGWLSNVHRAIRVARGLEDTGHFALEVVLVCSATLTVVAFGIWFFAFSGASPIPLHLGY